MGTLRGDPLLWKYLKNYYAAIELPYPVEHLKEDILRIFKDFTGELPVREKYYFVKEFSKNCNCIKYGDNAMKEFYRALPDGGAELFLYNPPGSAGADLSGKVIQKAVRHGIIIKHA